MFSNWLLLYLLCLPHRLQAYHAGLLLMKMTVSHTALCMFRLLLLMPYVEPHRVWKEFDKVKAGTILRFGGLYGGNFDRNVESSKNMRGQTCAYKSRCRHHNGVNIVITRQDVTNIEGSKPCIQVKMSPP